MSAADIHPVPPREERQARIARWRRRSRTIQVLRVLLPAAMALITLYLVGLVAWRSLAEQPRADRDAQTSIRLVNARFVGRVEDGRGFQLGAKAAIRSERDYQIISLTDPMLVVGAETARPARMSARAGVYNERDKLLRLKGDVRIDDGQGVRFTSQEAVIDTRTGKVVGDDRVAGEAPLGQMTAKSYSVEDKGDRMTFKGGVRARIGGDQGKTQ